MSDGITVKPELIEDGAVHRPSGSPKLRTFQYDTILRRISTTLSGEIAPRKGETRGECVRRLFAEAGYPIAKLASDLMEGE